MICPKCGSSMKEYNHKLAWGIGAAAVGALVLGPVGLVAGLVGADDSHKGWKCPQCGYSEQRRSTQAQKNFQSKLGNAMASETRRQFREGYQQGLNSYDDDDDDY